MIFNLALSSDCDASSTRHLFTEDLKSEKRKRNLKKNGGQRERVCVCVRERKKEREKERKKEREREWKGRRTIRIRYRAIALLRT